MDYPEKLIALRSFIRESDVHTLLLELLPRMGFAQVSFTHEDGNQPEYGKDLVAARMDEVEGRYEWTAFVVKKGRISGSTGVVSTVLEQVKECFEFRWESVHHGSVGMNKVKVVANGGVAAGAKDKIQRSVGIYSPNVSFWDDEKLIQFIDKHYAEYWIRFVKPSDYLKFVWAAGDSQTIPLIIDEDAVGRYESFSQDESSGVVSYSLNGSEFRGLAEPVVLDAGDRLVIRRAYTTRQGFSKWSG